MPRHRQSASERLHVGRAGLWIRYERQSALAEGARARVRSSATRVVAAAMIERLVHQCVGHREPMFAEHRRDFPSAPHKVHKLDLPANQMYLDADRVSDPTPYFCTTRSVGGFEPRTLR